MTDRELMQMALDVLLQSETNPHAQVELAAQEDAAIEALRARLAQPEPEPINYEEWRFNPMTGKLLWDKQPEPEPVAWMTVTMGEVTSMQPHMIAAEMFDGTHQLYTAPPQREWQGLTDEEIDGWNIVGHESLREFIRAIEAKLKAKNG